MRSICTALSRAAESLPLAGMTGNSFLMSSNSGDCSTDCRAYIQFTLPRTVLISPLWQIDPERMGKLPGRECVRRETLVHKAESAHRIGIRKLPIKLRDLRSEQQSLINDRARRKRRDVEEALVLDFRRFEDFPLGALHDDEKLALKRLLVHPGRASDEDLLDVWLAGAGDATDRIAVDRRVTPSEYC